MSQQDWTPVVIHGKTTNINSTKTIQSKSTIDNKSKQEKEIDNATEAGRLKQLSIQDRQTMIQMRTAKGLKQDQIAPALSMPLNLYKDIESGKTIPTQQQLSKINNYLKINLKLM
jgi:ribosome-binding protein aMBF1 (putative translation factor)